jgi:DNA-binding transcriptional LysR family regulator
VFGDVQMLVIFARVIQDRSFSRAAAELGTSTSAVSKRIARLEQLAGARLLARTTRHVAPTEAGLVLYERCLRILREVEEAELIVAGLTKAPRGLLRLSAPVYFGEVYVAPLIAELLQRELELRVELSLSDRFVDLVAEGFDLAVRIGALSGASLSARKLAVTPVVVCASPRYIARRGRPVAPKDLINHDCLRYSLDAVRHSWRFRGKKREAIVVPVTGPLEANHGGSLRQAAIAGLGLACLPSFYVAEALERGTLVTVLDEYCADELGVFAVYPEGKLVPPKTRVCIDYLAKALPASLVTGRDCPRGGAGALRDTDVPENVMAGA